jgi:hypothetical protein
MRMMRLKTMAEQLLLFEQNSGIEKEQHPSYKENLSQGHEAMNKEQTISELIPFRPRNTARSP